MVIYDDRDFGYPNCGGYIAKRGRRWITIERQSNYQGASTGVKWRAPIEREQEVLAILSSDEYIALDDIVWMHNVSRGYRVR